LESRNLEKLAKDKLINSFNYDSSKDLVFCQPCVDGKIHKRQFPTTGGKRAKKPFELIHSDVCGKVQTSSLSGCYYFLTFIEHSVCVGVHFEKKESGISICMRPELQPYVLTMEGNHTSAEFNAYLESITS